MGQQTIYNASVLPIIELVEQQSEQRPEQLVADNGYFACANLDALEALQIDVYLPDSNLAQANALIHRTGHLQSRKASVEQVFGVLKQHDLVPSPGSRTGRHGIVSRATIA
jgi:hypothetical protein